MAQVRQHANARLTPRQRRAMVDVLVVEDWSVAATAERFPVDAKTARKWRDRYLAEGVAGLVDRSSRPHNSPTRTPEATRRRVIELRTQRRRGAAWIAHHINLAPSTTTAASSTARSTTTNAATPPPGSGAAPSAGSPPGASPANAS